MMMIWWKWWQPEEMIKLIRLKTSVKQPSRNINQRKPVRMPDEQK